jgi:competence protein ComEC
MLALCLQWFSAMRYAVWSAPVPPFWMFCWAMLGTIWLLAPRGWPVRWLGLASWIPLLAAQPSHPASGQMTITAFDVGQGMALLIETRGHRLLYDTGPAYSPESDAGSRVILPYLRARGINALDGVIISHSDADHSGGALAVLDGIRTAWVLSSLPVNHAIVGPRVSTCPAPGQSWTGTACALRCCTRCRPAMPTPASSPTRAAAHQNHGRWQIHAAGRGYRGRAGSAAGRPRAGATASRYPAGAAPWQRHSSTPVFLRAVHPQAAIFQVGHRNRYHHPKPEVYERYGAMHIQRYRTDQQGAITLEFDETIRISTYRSTHGRYWQAR